MWLSKQNNVWSAGEVKLHLMLVSWQAAYRKRKRSGLLISAIQAVIATIADYLSDSLNLQELGKLPSNMLHTAQSLAFHKAPFQLLEFVVSVETQPRDFKFTNLRPLTLNLYELWIQTQNLKYHHIFACKLWILVIFLFNFVSTLSVNYCFGMYKFIYIAMVPFVMLSKTPWQ